MADDENRDIQDKPKKGKLPLILGVLLAVVGGGAGFYATWSGMILGAAPALETTSVAPEPGALPDVRFVALDPMVITLSDENGMRNLRLSAQLEVPTAHVAEVQSVTPRVVDVINTYLRALKVSDLEESAALLKLRSQMLYRVDLVTGGGRVNDILIMEFVLN